MNYLTAKEIIMINARVIQKYSPKETIGVREPGSLDMAVHSLQQEVFGQELYPTIELKAANLYRNLVLKHIFHNGNKRTAFTALVVFLRKNGLGFYTSQQAAQDFTVKIAVERLEEEEITKWIKMYLK